MTPPHKPDHALLLLTLDFPPSLGGIQAYLEGVARALAPAGDLLVVAPSDTDHPGSALYPIRRVRWPVRGAWKLLAPLLWSFAGARHLLQHPQRTVIVGHPHLALAGWLLSWVLRARWVQLAYGMEATDGRTAQLVRRLWPLPDRVVTISRATADHLVRLGARPERIVLLPPWIDLPDPNPGPEDGKLVAEYLPLRAELVLCVGRMSPAERYKGHDVLLTAWAAVATSRPDARLVLIGGGDDRERLQGLANQLGISEQVVFTGPIRRTVRDALYRRCKLVVLLSRELETRTGVRFEGFGIVLLEAGGFRRAVIGGDSGGVPDAIEDGLTGLLVDPNDAGALAPIMRQLLDDPARLRRMGRAGRRRVEREFTYDAERIRAALLDD